MGETETELAAKRVKKSRLPERVLRRRRRRRNTLLAIGAAVIALGLITYAVFPTVFPRSRRNRHRMRERMLAWARLAPFPPTAGEVVPEPEGGMFAPAYRAQFTDDPVAIQAWVWASPGLREGKVRKVDDNIVSYIIAPGEGAAHAEVTINSKLNLVAIYVSWR